MDPTTWLVALTGLVAAIVGAILTHVYRDFRDRPIIRLSVERVGRSRRPISLIDDVYDRVYPQGSFREWLDKIVKWNVASAIEQNRFSLDALKDIRHLIPRYLGQLDQYQSRVQRFFDSLAQPTNPPSEELAFTLMNVRATWRKQFQQDVFIEYSDDPAGVAAKLGAKFAGDLESALEEKDSLNAFLAHLETGLAPNAPAAERLEAPVEHPTNPRDPFIIVEILAQNTGKTETLMLDHAILAVGGRKFRLKAIVEDLGFEVFSGKFYSVEASSMQQMTFSQDPDRTNLDELQELRRLIEERRHRARVVLFDFRNKRFKTKRFPFREE